MQIMYGLHMEIMIKYIYEEKKSCFATILNLEAKYTTLTGLISSEIPLVNKMIDHCSPITKKNQEIKIYQIKKKNR